jgi:hypothetical protein
MSAQECQSGHAAEIVEDRPLCQRQRRRSRSMRYSLSDLPVPELMPEIDTIRAQFSKPTPSHSIVREAVEL